MKKIKDWLIKINLFMFFIPEGLLLGLKIAWVKANAPFFWPFDWENKIEMKPLRQFKMFGRDWLK